MPPTLTEAGIDKNLAKRAPALTAVSTFCLLQFFAYRRGNRRIFESQWGTSCRFARMVGGEVYMGGGR
jgi:hypothetical protein